MVYSNGNRREHPRVSYPVDMNLFVKQNDEVIRQNVGKIINLSTGGIQFTSYEQIDPKQDLIIEVGFKVYKHYVLQSTIAWRGNVGLRQFRYGCRWVNVPPSDFYNLTQDLFKYQLSRSKVMPW